MLYFKFFIFIFINGSDSLLRRLNWLSSLSKMTAHIALKVEVCKLILLAKRKKMRKLLISIDYATVLLVLKLVLTNVSIDLTSNLCASHLCTTVLTKECSELITDASWLYETTGSTVSCTTATLSVSLLAVLELAESLALEDTELLAKTRKEGYSLLKLGKVCIVLSL